MRRPPLCIIIAALLANQAHAGDVRIEPDPLGDASVRRTDAGNDGPIRPDTTLPDLLEVRLARWEASDASSDPFDGSVSRDGHFLRIDVVFDGLINPSGPVGISGQPFDPFRYGPSPALGFIELDIDNEADSGGQLADSAGASYLANVGRFGVTPGGDAGDRMVARPGDRDSDFFTAPQYERSGADLVLTFCGCDPVTLVSRTGGDDRFDAGETFVVRSRYFQRARGYRDACASVGGSAGGLYDPFVNARFRHDQATDRTEFSVVFALDPVGAAMLEGGAVQPIDLLIGIAGSHASVQESLEDLIDGAEGLNGPLSTPVATLTGPWVGEDGEDHLDPDDWRVAALVGTAYAVPQDTPYVWTDVANSRSQDQVTELLISEEIAARDGSSDDADGVPNGVVVIDGFPAQFSVYDVDYDGVVGPLDLMATRSCPPDLDGSGAISILDLLLYLDGFLAGDADWNGDGETDILDLLLYLEGFLAGC